jgi:general secretion pathway protein N
MGLAGRLRLTASSFEMRPDELQGSATLRWEGAASRLLPITQTGDYQLLVTGNGKRARLQLSTAQGVLQVDGEGEWRALEDGALRVQGTIAPSTPQPALDPILGALGAPRPDGRRNFNYQTRLPLPLRE